jgi:antirestriction protein ArdC
MATKTSKRADVYQRVTNLIVEQLERGVRPWLQPWNATHAAGRVSRPLRHNGECYNGINIITLWMECEARGFNSPYWLTFQQAKKLGGFVRKGEHGSAVVYTSTYSKSETGDDGEEVERDCRFLKQYTVFNSCQVEGLPERFYALAEPPKDTMHRIERADAFFAATGADIRHGGNRAYYTITGDYIQMPPFVAFRDAESHAATLAHELTHWTRHPSRLNRDFGRKRFGDEGYAVEELVAELGSRFLCADLEITPELRDDHASYISHWLKLLRQDKRAIFTAASHASRAVDFLHSLQPQPEA